MLLRSGAAEKCLHQLAMRHGYRIGQLCSELGCSERYLYSVFTRDIGLPPKLWRRWERMVVARRKLIGGKSPAEVAEDLGFSNANNFRREFLAIDRMPPLDLIRDEGLKPSCFFSYDSLDSLDSRLPPLDIVRLLGGRNSAVRWDEEGAGGRNFLGTANLAN